MNKDFIKGAEKCLSQDCQDCELGGRTGTYLDGFGCVMKKINLHHKKKLEQMIDYCVAMRSLGDDEKLTNRLFAVIDTLYCLDIIDDDESTDYRARLNGVKK